MRFFMTAAVCAARMMLRAGCLARGNGSAREVNHHQDGTRAH